MLHERRTPLWTARSYVPTISPAYSWINPDLTVTQISRFFTNGHFVFEQVAGRLIPHVISSGKGVIRTREKSYSVGAGDLFVFFPGEYYYYFDAPETPWRYTWLTLEGRLAVETLAAAGITEKTPHVTGNVESSLEPLLEEIAQAFFQPSTSPTFPIAAAWRFIDTVIRHAEQTTISTDRNYAELARQMMDIHFASIASVEEIARRLNISRSHLFRLFRDQYGISTKEYLDNLRLEQASRLLRQSSSTISEIAVVCGYQDGHYFSRAFRKRMGCAPGEYRAR